MRSCRNAQDALQGERHRLEKHPLGLQVAPIALVLEACLADKQAGFAPTVSARQITVPGGDTEGSQGVEHQLSLRRKFKRRPLDNIRH